LASKLHKEARLFFLLLLVDLVFSAMALQSCRKKVFGLTSSYAQFLSSEVVTNSYRYRSLLLVCMFPSFNKVLDGFRLG
jgi:hypothetical protein